MRHRLAALPLLALAFALPTAHADPFVGRVGTADTKVALRGVTAAGGGGKD